jgi:hypothetical protein
MPAGAVPDAATRSQLSNVHLLLPSPVIQLIVQSSN